MEGVSVFLKISYRLILSQTNLPCEMKDFFVLSCNYIKWHLICFDFC